jgi:hypothetical protein
MLFGELYVQYVVVEFRCFTLMRSMYVNSTYMSHIHMPWCINIVHQNIVQLIDPVLLTRSLQYIIRKYIRT